ncbi:MAG: hypothetical protein ACU84J_06310 [Gammaproteobacteria bacterium]
MKKLLCVAALILPFVSEADNVISDDSIIQGSQCIGVDCVTGELFSFETLRLKENNLRLRFVDTSSSASFPSTDWELVANDSTNGGRNRFSVEDVTAATEPFTVMGGTPSFSLFLSSSGNVGLGSDSPQKKLHLVADNSPTIRLEQSAAGGFPGVTWDIQANEDGLSVARNGELRLRLDSAGNLSLGGSVSASGIAPGTVPDYVFRKGYAPMPLAEVERFIQSNGHLPDIPSASEIERDGLNMTDMQLRLLKKVEELTLHVVAQQAQIEDLKLQLHHRREH